MPGDGALEIKNPRRILAVCLEDATQHLTRVVQELTGSAPEAASTTLAGSTHDLNLKTAYYTAVVPTWIDLIASPEEWSASFLSPEAREVLTVLGGLVLVFPLSGAQPTRDVIKQVGRVVKEGLGGWEWDGVGIAVGVGEGETEEWDELCAEAGLEFVQVTGSSRDQGRNEFGGKFYFSTTWHPSPSNMGITWLTNTGDTEKMGIARILEALEANDWEQGAGPLSDFGDFEGGDGDGGDDEFDPESLDFGFDRADFEGMRMDILGAGRDSQGGDGEASRMAEGLRGNKSEGPAAGSASAPAATEKPEGEKSTEEGGDDEELNDDDIAKLEKMMRKLQAAKEAGEGMSEDQRRRMAARAVEEVMREL
ncbi:unnamed protein product [Clonostachys byssicola]|uniref:Increased recombination centers protein 6 n=1 Tax=Clonostachys byssicola TaxID=160290 RepID=A0A9N9XWV5_9HYPO|nr:unnamed protein product [Clonostachys byssicola]